MQEIAKQYIYRNIIASQTGVDYSAGILFQIIIFNMDKVK